jgi:hypothetical protein
MFHKIESYCGRCCCYCFRSNDTTHLQVLLRGLLPLLGHGAGSDGAGEQAGGTENGKGSEDATQSDEQNLAALIRRRGAAGAVRTEGNEVSCSA